MPIPETTDQLLELVRKSGLVDDKQLGVYLDRMRPSLPGDAPSLAKCMVQDGLLTNFQAKLLMQGRWRCFVIGKYKLLERLGSGKQGSVFLCEHKVLRKRVAVKVLPDAKARDRSSLERLFRQVRPLAALSHPNIVRTIDIDQDGELHFLVMEYVDGTSLQEIVKRFGSLDIHRAAHYISQAAEGLQHVWTTTELVHRDIKPSNLLVDRTGSVKILHMGLSRFVGDEGAVLTKKHALITEKMGEDRLGTADYLAPEQVLDMRVDIRTDIYGLGNTFYFCLTSRAPFSEGTVAQKLIWLRARQPKPIRDLRPDVPEDLVAVIDKMIAKDPAQRYQTPAEVVKALKLWTQAPIIPPPEEWMPQLCTAAQMVKPWATAPSPSARPLTPASPKSVGPDPVQAPGTGRPKVRPDSTPAPPKPRSKESIPRSDQIEDEEVDLGRLPAPSKRDSKRFRQDLIAEGLESGVNIGPGQAEPDKIAAGDSDSVLGDDDPQRRVSSEVNIGGPISEPSPNFLEDEVQVRSDVDFSLDEAATGPADSDPRMPKPKALRDKARKPKPAAEPPAEDEDEDLVATIRRGGVAPEAAEEAKQEAPRDRLGARAWRALQSGFKQVAGWVGLGSREQEETAASDQSSESLELAKEEVLMEEAQARREIPPYVDLGAMAQSDSDFAIPLDLTDVLPSSGVRSDFHLTNPEGAEDATDRSLSLERPAFPREERKEIRRHTDVSFPGRVPLDKTCTLRIQIVPAEVVLPTGEVQQLPKPHAHDEEMLLQVPQPARPEEPPPPIRVTVSVFAENFAIDGETHAEIVVPLEGKSAAAVFRLRGEQVGPGRVMVDFAQNGRPVGAVNLNPHIVAGDQSESKEQAPGDPGEGGLNLAPHPEPAPDVVIKVFVHRYAGTPGRLHFVLSSTHPDLQDLPVWDGDLGTLDLHSEVSAWVENQLRPLGLLAERSTATGQDVHKTLCDVGYNLYEQLLPAALQEMCWTFRQRGIKTVLILSDEPHIPWELIKPYRADPASGMLEKEDCFWGESFALTHWLRGRPAVQHLSFQRVFAVAAGGSRLPEDGTSVLRDMVLAAPESKSTPLTANTDLLLADEELAVLRSLKSAGATVQVLPARRQQLYDAFERGDFDLLHLVCHGSFGGSATADASAVLMEDGLFSAAELSPRLAGALRRAAPLIVFNACHSGRIGFSLTRLGSWGARLVQLGCGGFIGAQWPVTDQAALVFAQAFYECVAQGLPLGEAVLRARHRVRERYPNDPSWLAYCCFADPMARMEKAASPRSD